MHVPTDEIPSALRMSSRQWRDSYHCDKPAQGDPVVMQCRTNRRASWAAQIAQDAGFKKCLVYRQVRAQPPPPRPPRRPRPFLLFPPATPTFHDECFAHGIEVGS